MTGLGVGSANPGATPPGLPLGSAIWAPGFAFDLIGVSGSNGSPMTSGIVSLAGSNVLLPVSNPLINYTSVGGQHGCFVQDTGVSGTEPLYTCNAVAGLFQAGQLFSIYGDFRSSKQAQMPLVSVLSSTTADAMQLLIIGERLCWRWTIGGVTTTVTGLIPLAYDYHRLGVTYDGTTLRLWVDGVADTSAAMPSLAIALNRFSWLGSISSVAFEGATGYARRLFFTPSFLSAGNIATVDAYFVAGDYTLEASNPAIPEFILAGASIEDGASDHVTGAGWRAGISQNIILGRQSWKALGANPQGFVPYRETPSTSGQSAVNITAQVTSLVNSRVKFVQVDLGNQEINSGFTKAQVEAAIVTALHNMRAAAYAANPQCYFVVNTILPYFEAPFNTIVQGVNADLPAIWSASDAEFPSSPKLLRWDGNAAMGGPSYIQANYDGTGDDHPNNVGYNLCIPAMLAASNSDGQVFSTIMAALSPT